MRQVSLYNILMIKKINHNLKALISLKNFLNSISMDQTVNMIINKVFLHQEIL